MQAINLAEIPLPIKARSATSQGKISKYVPLLVYQSAANGYGLTTNTMQ